MYTHMYMYMYSSWDSIKVNYIKALFPLILKDTKGKYNRTKLSLVMKMALTINRQSLSVNSPGIVFPDECVELDCVHTS